MQRTNWLIVGCLAVLMNFTLGCGSSQAPAEQEEADEVSAEDLTAGETVAIDPAELSPDALVFAAGRGGGFLMSPEQIFFVEHYGDSRIYIFGDRRVIRHVVLAGVAGYHQQQGHKRSASDPPCRHGCLLPGIPTILIVRCSSVLLEYDVAELFADVLALRVLGLVLVDRQLETRGGYRIGSVKDGPAAVSAVHRRLGDDGRRS
jgi:hypothetical protein